MKKKLIIKICEKNKKKFSQIIRNTKFEIRGMLNSELLLVFSLASYLNINQIIESGRARGYSTKILARSFLGSEKYIQSIDYDRFGKDVKFSEKNLKKYRNIKLFYGDSIQLIPKLIKEDCIVIIDGPKGERAIQLALKILKDKRVKIVFIHDLHKNTFSRNLAEILFPHAFFSDDKNFVQKFKDLDKPIWEQVRNTGRAPYKRKGEKSESYGPTLAVIFNSNTIFDNLAIKNYIKHKSKKEGIKNKILKKLQTGGLVTAMIRESLVAIKHKLKRL